MSTQLIWDQYATDLKKFIFSKTQNASVTEDLLQDVFLKIHLKKTQLKNQSALKSWLFSIAHHTVLDFFKTQKKELPTEVETSVTLPKENNHSPKDCLLPLIEKLPDTYKQVLLLATLQGCKQAEIAQKLNLSLAATKSRILRGKELLKQSYMDCCNYTLDENGHLKGEHKNIDDCKVCRVRS
ncbi:sigma-70 family RNA polymerase sigma factor [Ochrovirga pacifica]|uniref:sigma-70 family RNA polymerase sigma factor n=1 Tax=Ochrovirga pacifica TaxID=1042376 RepID=UPI0002559FDF|nr:sigma-70 family RNA polymerase sigma factor [Ochrovirga pacifica]